MPSPYERALGGVDPFRCHVDVGDAVLAAREALRCHRSQIDPAEPWFFAVPDDAIVDVYRWEDFQLLATVDGLVTDPPVETDLFEGLV